MRTLISLPAFKNKKIVLLTHVGADLDAMAAAAALSLVLGKNNSVVIGVPEHAAVEAKRLAQRMGISYKVNPPLEKADALILVDFNSWGMLGEMQEAVKSFSGEKYLLDHHNKTADQIVPAKNAWVNPEAIASCMLVLEWTKKSGIALDKKVAGLLAVGITADSAHLMVADAGTFAAMAELLKESGKRFSEILALLHAERDFSEKIAMLKAAKRSRIFKLGEYIAVTAEVGAFEADSATALVKIGADIAFVGNDENNELKVSGRASQKILAKTNLDLSIDVFQRLGAFFNGNGGGHAGAAAFNGKGNLEQALQKCLELAKKAISKKLPKAQLKEYT